MYTVSSNFNSNRATDLHPKLNIYMIGLTNYQARMTCMYLTHFVENDHRPILYSKLYLVMLNYRRL